MTIKEAIEYLSEGHTEWTVEEAKKICQAFKFELPNGLIDHWKNQKEANPTNDPKGLFLAKDEAGTGVSSFRLSNWITDKLNLKVEFYYGRGSQARANGEAIAKHFSIA
jgi:hypothetical protein